MRPLRTIVVLALPLALLGACSDDDDGGGGSGSTTTPTAADQAAGDADGRTEEQLDADQALADRIVLTADDVGQGWILTDDPDDADDDEDTDDELLEDDLAECLDVDPDQFPDEESTDPEAETTFEQEEAEIESSAAVAATTDELDRFFDVFGSDSFAGCYEDLLGQELQKDSEADEEAEEADIRYLGTEVTELDLPSGLGDDAVGLRATISIEAEGVPFETYQYLYFVRRGRVAISLTAISSFEPLPEQYVTGLAALMDERAAGA